MSSRTWNSQFKTLPNQSLFHEELRKIFCEDTLFSHLRCYQEVDLQELIPEYKYRQHRFDFYIEEMRCVIELHGKQHYKRTTFGTLPYSQSLEQFEAIKRRDSAKKSAAETAGFSYVEIPYTMQRKLTADYIKQRIYGSTNATDYSKN